jgi:DnaJ-class molecular chaperone
MSFLRLPITSIEAILGTEIEIINLEDKPIKINVPAGVYDGYVIGLYNEGVYKRNGNRGELIVVLNIETTQFGKEKNTELQKLRESENATTNPRTFDIRKKMSNILRKEP